MAAPPRGPRGPDCKTTKPGKLCDLGGIGNGYAANEATLVLREHGVTRAVVAASVTLFAVELRNHHTSAPGPSLPASASLLKQMPVLGNGGVPASAQVLIPLTRGHGSVRLKTFVPHGMLLLQYDCAGPGPFKISSTNGVVGIKPTLGLIPATGIIPIAHSQDTAGPMARSGRQPRCQPR